MINSLEEMKGKLHVAYKNATEKVESTQTILDHVDKEIISDLLAINIAAMSIQSILRVILEDLGEQV